MKSIAIWYSKNSNNPNKVEQVELHFNLWKIPVSKNHFKRFIDIGIKLDRTDCVEKLKIYFPAKFDKKNFTDIVRYFINDNDLVCAIFNENYKTISQPNSKIFKIQNQNDEHLFNIYQLEETDYTIQYKYSGTIISITPPHDNNKLYFRIRIDSVYCNSLILIQKPSNSFIQSAFSKIELTDFRVNEVRDLDKSLLEEISQECQLKISKGHFFYMISSNEEVINYHIPFISCRNLEKNKWNKYVGDHSLSDDETILAYHWKVEDVSDFDVLIKSKFESNNWSTIGIYLLVLFLFTIFLNLTSSYLFELLKR